jgi:uncharacterized SAM-binding protein YcdF (DUF218 family)
MLSAARSLAYLIELPLALALALSLAATALWALKHRAVARGMALIAGAVAYGGSIPLSGDALRRPLEQRYGPLTAVPVVDAVVVLGSSYSPRAGVPVAAALDGAGLVRIVTGVGWAERLAARLVVSGGAPAGEVPAAQGYAALALELGIPAERIVLLEDSLDTRDEATAVAAFLESRPFLLVTSAYHMPRAVRLMERAGARPIPAPTDQQVAPYDGLRWTDFIPRASALERTEAALHEYLGLAALAAGLD